MKQNEKTMAICLECQQEGTDPHHTRLAGDKVGPCQKHYMRQLRANTEFRERERENLQARREQGHGWCPECEAEGADDPRHGYSKGVSLCNKHWLRQYRRTARGRAALQKQRETPMQRALRESEKEKSNGQP